MSPRSRFGWVPQIAEPLQPVLDIKETRLPTIPLLSANRGSRRTRQLVEHDRFLEPSN